jgi:uncharacterized protein (TIGR00290 family)
MSRQPILLSWSGGKDCALALQALGDSPSLQVVGLVSGICDDTGRLAIHEAPRTLLQQQAMSLGLPWLEVPLPAQASNQQYEAAWREFFRSQVDRGIRHVAYGDLFLEDIRAYRVAFLQGQGIEPVFPIWGRSTSELALAAIAGGLKAIVCSIDHQRLDRRFVGREFDRQFVRDLPPGVDPCGENGEFHTFVYDGPGFAWPVPFGRGEVCRRGSVDFCDLIPVQPSVSASATAEPRGQGSLCPAATM